MTMMMLMLIINTMAIMILRMMMAMMMMMTMLIDDYSIGDHLHRPSVIGLLALFFLQSCAGEKL